MRAASLMSGSALAIGLGQWLGLIDVSVNQRARREALQPAPAMPAPKIEPVAVPHKVEALPAIDLEALLRALEKEPRSVERRSEFERALIQSAEALMGASIRRCVAQAEVERNAARRAAALGRCLKRFQEARANP
jgi:hypothetical protein